MKQLVVVVTSIIFLNMVSCYIYCSIRASRRKKELISTPDGRKPEISKQMNNKRAEVKQLIRILYREYRRVMDCVLRLNLFYTSYIPTHHVRDFLYRHIFKINMKRGAVIYYGAEIRAPWNITIGEGSLIGDRAILDGRNGIQIGANVNISTNASIWTMQHDVNDPNFRTGGVQLLLKTGYGSVATL